METIERCSLGTSMPMADLPGMGGLDPDVHRGQGHGEVVGETGDLGDPDAALGLDLVAGQNRAALVVDNAGDYAKAGEGVLQRFDAVLDLVLHVGADGGLVELLQHGDRRVCCRGRAGPGRGRPAAARAPVARPAQARRGSPARGGRWAGRGRGAGVLRAGALPLSPSRRSICGSLAEWASLGSALRRRGVSSALSVRRLRAGGDCLHGGAQDPGMHAARGQVGGSGPARGR